MNLHLTSFNDAWKLSSDGYSQSSISCNPYDSIAIWAHRLVDVVGIRDVLREAFLRRALRPLPDDLLAHTDVLLHHLNGEDVVDLDVMGREAVVEEAGREHHAIASEPELRLILLVEVQDIPRADETESTEDHVRGDEPGEEARVVEWSVVDTKETRENRPLHGDSLVNHKPPVVREAHDAAEAVMSILALAHLEEGEDTSNRAATLCKTLIHEVLHTLRVLQKPGLKSFSHFINFVYCNKL